MVPSKNYPKWAALVQDRFTHKLSNAAAAMLLFRVQSDVKQDDSSGALVKAIEEMHAFFTKYERMLESEISAIFG